MVLTEAGTKGIRGTFGNIEKIMKEIGFVRWSWDYGKANFDMKFSTDTSNYYLRIQARVTQGALENPKAQVELDNPVFLRHIFPHGLDGNTEIPKEFTQDINKAVQSVKEALS